MVTGMGTHIQMKTAPDNGTVAQNSVANSKERENHALHSVTQFGFHQIHLAETPLNFSIEKERYQRNQTNP